MRASPHCLQQLPQSALPTVSVYSPGCVASGEGQGTTSGAVLSRRVYHPGATCATGIAEPASLLRVVIPGGIRDVAGNRRRSPAAGSEDRLSGGAAHLEPEPAIEPSLMMPGITISFVFSEQRRLVARTAPV